MTDVQLTAASGRYGTRKRCSKCGLDMPLSNFAINKAGSSILDSTCKACRRLSRKALCAKRAEHNKAKPVDLTGSKVCSDCESTLPKACFYVNVTSKDGLQGICKVCARVRSVIDNAQPRGYEVSIGKERIRELIMDKCYYCGEPGSLENVLGVDRADNSLGYTHDNSVSCCKACNLMKGKFGSLDFVEHAAKIVAHSLRNVPIIDGRSLLFSLTKRLK